MKKIYITVGFILVVFIQLYVPSKMILDQEDVLEKGKAYKFITRPIDPNDPFRGKYVTLNYAIDSFKTKDTTWLPGEDVYVYLRDSLGYAKVDTIARKKLVRNTDYVVARATWLRRKNLFNDKSTELNFDLPFDRFYMEEFKAKPAEDAVRIRRNDTVSKHIYGLVYVKDGASVLNNVFIDDIAIKDYVEQNRD